MLNSGAGTITYEAKTLPTPEAIRSLALVPKRLTVIGEFAALGLNDVNG